MVGQAQEGCDSGASARACTRISPTPRGRTAARASVAGAASELLAPAEPVEVALEAPVETPLKRPTNALSLGCRSSSPARGWGAPRGACRRGSRRRAPPVGGHRAGRGSLLQRDERHPGPSSAPSASSQKQSPVSLTPHSTHIDRRRARRGGRRGRCGGRACPSRTSRGSGCPASTREVRAVHLEGLPARRQEAAPHHLADAHPHEPGRVQRHPDPGRRLAQRQGVGHARREPHPRGRGQLRAGEQPERAGAEGPAAPPAQPPLAAGGVAALPHEGGAAAPRAAVGLAGSRGELLGYGLPQRLGQLPLLRERHPAHLVYNPASSPVLSRQSHRSGRPLSACTKSGSMSMVV